MHALITLLALSLSLTLTTAADRPLVLPGATGPLFEEVAKLQGGFKVIGADVSDSVTNLNLRQPPRSRTLPAGIRELRVHVAFNKPPEDAKISLDIYNQAGKVECSGGFGVVASLDDRKGGATLTFPRGFKQGKFPNGAYQARLKFGDQVFLLVNWQIGELPK